jgi:hypothetical protein
MDDSIKPATNQGFFSYVFMLTKFKRDDLLNIVQYMTLATIPIILVMYFSKKYLPQITYEDSSLYIFIVTLIEMVFIVICIFFIDRIINFIPTLSGKYYEIINLTNVIIIYVLLMMFSQAGYRERISILLHRFDNWFKIDDMLVRYLGYTPRPFDIFTHEAGQYNLEVGRISGEGRPDVPQDTIAKAKASMKNKSGTAANNKGTQPTTINPQISQQYAAPPPVPVQGPSMSNYGGGGMSGGGSMGMTQPVQNFNSMYANTATPMVGAATPGMDDMFMEPEAANGALGGSSWSSW